MDLPAWHDRWGADWLGKQKALVGGVGGGHLGTLRLVAFCQPDHRIANGRSRLVLGGKFASHKGLEPRSPLRRACIQRGFECNPVVRTTCEWARTIHVGNAGTPVSAAIRPAGLKGARGAQNCMAFGAKGTFMLGGELPAWAACPLPKHGWVGPSSPRGPCTSLPGWKFGEEVRPRSFPKKVLDSELDWPITGA